MSFAPVTPTPPRGWIYVRGFYCEVWGALRDASRLVNENPVVPLQVLQVRTGPSQSSREDASTRDRPHLLGTVLPGESGEGRHFTYSSPGVVCRLTHPRVPPVVSLDTPSRPLVGLEGQGGAWSKGRWVSGDPRVLLKDPGCGRGYPRLELGRWDPGRSGEGPSPRPEGRGAGLPERGGRRVHRHSGGLGWLGLEGWIGSKAEECLLTPPVRDSIGVLRGGTGRKGGNPLGKGGCLRTSHRSTASTLVPWNAGRLSERDDRAPQSRTRPRRGPLLESHRRSEVGRSSARSQHV